MKREIIFNEVHDSQLYYRLVLDSMARPGRINKLPDMDLLPPTGLHKASAIIALSLLNSDVAFHIDGINAQQIASYLTLNTSSTPVEVEQADFIFLQGNNSGFVLADSQIGTLSYPEQGATCIVDVSMISAVRIPNAVKITLRGPGVLNESEVYVSGLNVGILENLSAQNVEFPMGIDLIFTDIENSILSIPRSNRFTWEVSSN